MLERVVLMACCRVCRSNNKEMLDDLSQDPVRYSLPYYLSLPEVKAWQAKVIADAQQNGYTTTLAG